MNGASGLVVKVSVRGGVLAVSGGFAVDVDLFYCAVFYECFEAVVDGCERHG